MDFPNDFDNFKEIRNNIVHGNKPRDIDQIRYVSENIDGIKSLASLVLQKILDNDSLSQLIL